MKSNCDIFAYGEALAKNHRGLSLPGYFSILHSYKPPVPNGCRRGIVIFCLEKYQQIISKVYASDKFDIIWLCLPSGKVKTYFCFFYAPGDHHNQSLRMKFYSALQESFDKFSKLGKIFMLGDTNARLGSVLGDKNIKGVPVSNKNKPLLLGFLDYSGLQVLNLLFAKGIATYEIINRKKSIIDLCLTDSISAVKNFQVVPYTLGFNAQTCHKIIRLELLMSSKQESPTTIPKIKRFRHCSFFKLEEVRDYVCSKLEDIRDIKEQCGLQFLPTYNVFKKLYTKAKEKILGYTKHNHNSSWAISPRIIRLQKLFRKATSEVKQKSDLEIFRLQNLEHLMRVEYYRVKNGQFSKWLGKLSKLDYKRRTRTFFRELRKKQKETEHFGPIKDSSGKLSKSWTESLDNWATFYELLYKGKKPSSLVHSYKKNESLDDDFSTTDLVLAVDKLKDYRAPGTDNILGEDFTVLLRADPEDENSTLKNVKLLKIIHAIIFFF